MQTIIDYIYDIYEPLRQALQTYGTLKAYVKIIPIVIISLPQRLGGVWGGCSRLGLEKQESNIVAHLYLT